MAVDGVSFTFAPGECLAVVGESGSGKSTLARSLLRLIEPDSGAVLYRGDRHPVALGQSDMREKRRHLQMVFQDPYASLHPRRSIAQMISEPWEIHRAYWRANAAGPGRRASRPGEPAGRLRRSSPEPAFGRAAAACGDRPRAGARTRDPDPRRARLGPRRLRAGADHQSPDDPAAASGPRLCLHLPRPGAGPPRGRPGRGDAPRRFVEHGPTADIFDNRRTTTRARCSPRRPRSSALRAITPCRPRSRATRHEGSLCCHLATAIQLQLSAVS